MGKPKEDSCVINLSHDPELVQRELEERKVKALESIAGSLREIAACCYDETLHIRKTQL